MAEMTESFSNYWQLYRWIVSNYNYRRFCEVGIWKGGGIKKLWEYIKDRDDVEIYGVDIFDDLEVENQCKENLNGTGIRVMKERSVDAAKYFTDGYFDMVFIDADHSYESVLADIRAWMPKIRDGGMIAGHDYVESQPGVKKAVHECFGTLKENGIDGVQNYSWFKYKDVENGAMDCADRFGHYWQCKLNQREAHYA
jgi:cephalosporin hydroxylase